MTAPGDVPPEFLTRLRAICRELPESYEEPAWVGVRWRIRKRTIAHVYTVDPGHRAARARAAGTDEPTCVVTFRASLDEVRALVAGGHPFFKADWGADVLGLVLDEGVDWAEVGELLTESYCLLAPKKLAAQLTGPVGRP
ncbi:MmcQ/YjbR family DNA-binding protein [Micromonospora sp. NPDC004336]